jgi:hypothetical protein
MSLNSIYNQKQTVIDRAVNSFVKDAKKSESEISELVFKIVRRYNNKDLSITQKAQVINEIEEKILQNLRKSNFKTGVEKFLSNLSKIDSLTNKMMFEANGIKGGLVKNKELQKFATSTISDNFLGKGLEANVVEPLKQRIAQNLIAGADNATLEGVISDYFKTDDTLGRLTRYVSQISTDSLNGYAGMINNEYRKEYGLTNFIYVGSLIEDSRGQCRHWTSKDRISVEELEQEIPIAIDGGFLGGFKCSGMKDWTNIDNFTIERGGFNCRHEAVPVY